MRDTSLRTQQKEDKLFKEQAEWGEDACLNYMPDNMILYADGYKLAADILIESTTVYNNDLDSLVYPIIFLYRHYLELRLKSIITEGSRLPEFNEKSQLEHHNINKLWKDCRKILEKVCPNELENLNLMEKYIKQFSEKDPFSTAFRYPEDKKGTSSLPGLYHINLRNFAEIMKELSSFLDGANMKLSEYVEMKCEERGYWAE